MTKSPNSDIVSLSPPRYPLSYSTLPRYILNSLNETGESFLNHFLIALPTSLIQVHILIELNAKQTLYINPVL